jgi:hypothetical protein
VAEECRVKNASARAGTRGWEIVCGQECKKRKMRVEMANTPKKKKKECEEENTNNVNYEG